MSQPIISVEHLSKAYRLGLKEEIPDTFVGAFTGWLKAPVRNWRRLRRLNTFGESPLQAAARIEDHGAQSENGKANGNGHPPSSLLDPQPIPQIPQEESDTLWALRDVSFEVHEGEVVGIIGRNGAGKSTLLKILSRITEPTHGRAIIRGRVSSLLEVGTGFHPELTGRENIYMNGTILGMRKKEIDKKFAEIVDFSGVEKFLDTPIKRYSSGMKVRLAFAVAAHLEPEILIIDEVLAVGDAEFQKKCLGKMQDVAEGGRTVLFVSHNMAAVEALCSKGVLLQNGSLAQFGGIIEILASYHETWCATSRASEYMITGKTPSEPSICSALVLNDARKATNTLLLGETFRIKIQISTPRRLHYPIIGIGINDPLGHRLISVNSGDDQLRSEAVSEAHFIVCEIPRFPLAPGTYSVTLVLRERNRDLDHVENAFMFTVAECNTTGNSHGFHGGICYATSKWTTAEYE